MSRATAALRDLAIAAGDAGAVAQAQQLMALAGGLERKRTSLPEVVAHLKQQAATSAQRAQAFAALTNEINAAIEICLEESAS